MGLQIVVAVLCVIGQFSSEAVFKLNSSKQELYLLQQQVNIVSNLLDSECPNFINKRVIESESSLSVHINVARKLYNGLVKKYVECQAEKSKDVATSTASIKADTTTTVEPTTTPPPPYRDKCEVKKCAPSYTMNPHTNTCYKLYGAGKNWQNGRKQCIDEGGDLATFPTEKSADWMFNEIKQNGGAFYHWGGAWIGGEIIGGTWQWVGLAKGPIAYDRWARDQPDGYENCMEILDQNGFNDGDCSWTHRNFLCEQTTKCV